MAMLPRYTGRYVNAVLAADHLAAASVISDALQHGVGLANLYMDVFVPAQVAVGDRWHAGEINVAQEHAATQITLAQMQRLRATLPENHLTGPRAVVASVQEELHDLGARVVADFLTMDGWQ